MLRGTPSARSSSSSHFSVWMLNISVRDALVVSVMWRRPSVSFHSSHVSTVPNASSPASARLRTPATLSRIHASFVPEKYASSTRPVRSRKSGSAPSERRRSQMPAVRRSCQTIALATGCPVFLSHTIVVSRWLVMPIEATSFALAPAPASTSTATPACDVQISIGSCSTQPG